MINLKGVVKKLNLSRFIIHEKLMCVGIRLIISVTFLLLVVSVRLQAQDTKVSHPFMWKSPDFVNVSPKNHLQIMGRYVDVVS